MDNQPRQLKWVPPEPVADDSYALATARLAELGATTHLVRDAQIKGRGRFRKQRHYYALPTPQAESDAYQVGVPYMIAVLGLGIEHEKLSWFSAPLESNLGRLLRFSPRNVNPGVELLQALAKHLERQGHARSLTAETAYLYYRYLGGIRGDRQSKYSRNLALINRQVKTCTQIALLNGLSLDERMDAAERHADPVMLQGLLDEGLPYMLVKEMFSAAN